MSASKRFRQDEDRTVQLEGNLGDFLSTIDDEESEEEDHGEFVVFVRLMFVRLDEPALEFCSGGNTDAALSQPRRRPFKTFKLPMGRFRWKGSRVGCSIERFSLERSPAI